MLECAGAWIADNATTRHPEAPMAAMRKTATRPERPRPAIPHRQTKEEIIGTIAAEIGLSRRQVAIVFGALGELLERHLKRRGSGEFTIPETGVRVRRVRKPARKARTGRNPSTGEPIHIPAKPAGVGVRLTALKRLREAVKH